MTASKLFGFDRKVSQEINQMFSKAKVKDASVIRAEDIAQLPSPVQKWITNSGIIGKRKIQSVRLKQKAKLKMKPDQKKWQKASAEQYFTTEEPAFIQPI